MGYLAGINNTTGSSNDDIGHWVRPPTANIIRIGTPGIQTNTIIAGTVYGDGGGLTNLNAAQPGQGNGAAGAVAGQQWSQTTHPVLA